jgi:hypothetical protein
MKTDDIRGNEEIVMVTKLVAEGNNSIKLVICYISWRYKIYDNVNNTIKRKTCTRCLL